MYEFFFQGIPGVDGPKGAKGDMGDQSEIGMKGERVRSIETGMIFSVLKQNSTSLRQDFPVLFLFNI